MIRRLLQIILPLSMHLSAASTEAIDQEQSLRNVTMVTIGGQVSYGIFQSFIQQSENVSGAGVYLTATNAQLGAVKISLFDGLTDPSNPPITSASTVARAGWADVFWSPVQIEANRTYYILVEGDNWLQADGHTGDPYDRGQLWIKYGNGQYVDGYDLTFRTFASSVDELPGVLSLSIGLLALTAIRRIRELSPARAA